MTSKSKKKLNGPQTLFVDSARTRIENLDAVAHAPNDIVEATERYWTRSVNDCIEFYISLHKYQRIKILRSMLISEARQ